jgi:transcriptional regulator with XRE-family HTH domain
MHAEEFPIDDPVPVTPRALAAPAAGAEDPNRRRARPLHYPTPDPATPGGRLCLARERRNWGQQALAQALGFKKGSSISGYEQGKRDPNPGWLRDAAVMLGCSLAWLRGQQEDPEWQDPWPVKASLFCPPANGGHPAPERAPDRPSLPDRPSAQDFMDLVMRPELAPQIQPRLPPALEALQFFLKHGHWGPLPGGDPDEGTELELGQQVLRQQGTQFLTLWTLLEGMARVQDRVAQVEAEVCQEFGPMGERWRARRHPGGLPPQRDHAPDS